MTEQNTPGENVPAEAADATPAAQIAEALTALAEAAAPAKPKRTRSRKAAAPVEPTVEVTLPEAAQPSEPEGAPAAKPKRTRARKAAAPAQAPAAEVTADEAGAGAGAADAVAEPAVDVPAADAPAPRARKRATSRGSRSKTPATDAAAEPVDGGTAEAAAPESEPHEPSAAPAADASTSVRVGGAPRLATTALLFQAPQPPARPRRRRAEAPAGPPRHPDEQPAGVVVPGEDEDGVETVEVETAALDEAVAEDAVETAEVEREAADEAGEPADDDESDEGAESAGSRRRRRRGGRGRRGRSGAHRDDDRDDAAEGGETGDERAAEHGAERGDGSAEAEHADGGAGTDDEESGDAEGGSSSSRRRRRRRRSGGGGEEPAAEARPARSRARTDEVTALKGSTRLEAKRQRRREGRDAGRRRTIITEAEFLARREAVERTMVVRENDGRVQIGVVEDGVLVEHYVSRSAANSGAPMAGNVYLGRVQNVLPSMEAAFVDIGKGRNAVLYAGEVNWDAAGLEGQPRRIEQALKSGDPVLVQVTKEPVGHKGARLTSQITLAGRYLVYVPGGGMTGISRKLPDTERARLKKILKEIVPDDAGVIVRTAAEGASDDELRRDVQRLQDQWAAIEKKSKTASAPALLQGEPDLAIRVVRDVFNDDFTALVVQGEDAWRQVSDYVGAMAPDLAGKVQRWSEDRDLFAAYRVDEQLAKGMDRKVWLPSGGSLVIDRTEAMTVIDVNTGKFTGSGGTLEETVTRNNLEAAEEIVRQLRLRDIGGIIVIDFIDMVLESNRDLVLRRLVECLGRDRTKHQVAEVTSLGLVQMTRKRVGQGLVEAFSETCQACNGRGFIVHSEPLNTPAPEVPAPEAEPKRGRRKKASVAPAATVPTPALPVLPEAREAVKATLATIAAAAAHAHEQDHEPQEAGDGPAADGAEPAASTSASADAPEAPVADAPAAELADALGSIAAVEGDGRTGEA